MLLVCKHYIYSIKCQKKQLNFRDMLTQIYNTEKTELGIANSKNKYAQHYTKWYLLITS